MTIIQLVGCLLLITNLYNYEGLAHLKNADYQKAKHLG